PRPPAPPRPAEHRDRRANSPPSAYRTIRANGVKHSEIRTLRFTIEAVDTAEVETTIVVRMPAT
ncbi:MAG: hypothetical protein ACLP0L_04640, partial [Solirubrobacteraceae bacterium]